MLQINKGREPSSLTAYRKKPYATYDGCNKADIRRNLLVEQGCLCAYCMRRIREDNMQIEHWYPESKLSEAEKLDYSNMFGVCTRSEGLEKRFATCDAKKGNTLMTLDPRRADHIQTIKYETATGRILSDNAKINHDLNETLNLNCEMQLLPQNRRAKLVEVLNQIKKMHPTGTWTAANIAPIRRLYENGRNGELPEYAGIVRWWLRKFP